MSSTRLNYLFYRCFDGLATVGEKKELMELLAQSGNEDDIKALMEESWETFHSDHKRMGSDKSLEILRAALRSHPAGDGASSSVPVIPIKRRTFTWPRVAAAAVILVAAAALYWRGGGPHGKVPIAASPAVLSP